MSKDCNHFERFKQIKSEIRGSKDYLIVGIDIAKDKHYAFFGDANGRTLLKRLPFANSAEGYRKLIVHTEEKQLKFKLDKVVFGVEPTANYHKPLSEFLIRNNYQIVLVSNGVAKKNRETLDGRWDKNDMKDSANVADLISQGKCLYYDQALEEIKQLRSLLSLRKKFKKQEHGMKVRIRNQMVAQYFPELDSYFSTLEKGCLSIIEHCFDPKEISSLELMDFISQVTPSTPTLGQYNKLRSIWELAPHSIGCDMNHSAVFEATFSVQELRKTRAGLVMIEKEMKQICEKIPEYTFLLTIPGFGPIISAQVISAIGDPNRFSNGKQILKMAGLDLSANRSGKNSLNIIGKISKKGKADLRYALYQAALVASSRNIDFKAYFNAKLKDRSKEPGIRMKMRIKLAAKMLIIAWTLMKKKEVFNSDFLVISKK